MTSSLAYTAGDDHVLDNRLVRHDIRASIAHAEMLEVQGLLSAQDLASIKDALSAIGEEHARGDWSVSLEHEDCQTAIENLLTARIGAASFIGTSSRQIFSSASMAPPSSLTSGSPKSKS